MLMSTRFYYWDGHVSLETIREGSKYYLSFWPSPSKKKKVLYSTIPHLVTSYDEDVYRIGRKADSYLTMFNLPYESKMSWLPNWYIKHWNYSYVNNNCCRAVVDALQDLSGLKTRGWIPVWTPEDAWNFALRIKNELG